MIVAESLRSTVASIWYLQLVNLAALALLIIVLVTRRGR